MPKVEKQTAENPLVLFTNDDGIASPGDTIQIKFEFEFNFIN